MIKMAKASEADLKMAMELCNALESMERYRYMPDALTPSAPDAEPVNFDMDSGDDCIKVVEYLLRLTRSASLMRVVCGMATLLDPRNKIVDPEADTLEHHPDTVKALSAAPELLEALQLVVDLASQEWQESDGSRKCATDNQGRRLWFISPDMIDEVRAAIAKATGEKA